MATEKQNIITRPALTTAWDLESQEIRDPEIGISKPELMARMLVLDAIRMYRRLIGCAPNRLHIPRSLEATLQVDRGRNLGLHEKDYGKLRDSKQLFGYTVVWDATEFRVD